MMSTLLDQAVAMLRSKFSVQEVPTVQPYGGEFHAEEIGQVSFSTPAIFVTVLGWTPTTESERLIGKDVREARLVAFVVFKHAERPLRLAGAMNLAERAVAALRLWVPAEDLPSLWIAPLEEEAEAENLYSRAIDKHTLALWMVRWLQCVKSKLPLPELYELLEVEIHDDVEASPPAPAPPPNPLSVPEEVTFQLLPPPDAF